MTDSAAFQSTMKNFLLGLSVGVLLATILKLRSNSVEATRDIVDIASEQSFPASDAPAY